MGSNLIIDIGNSSIKIAVFKKAKLVFFQRVQKLYVKEIKELNQKFGFSNVILSSVRKSLPRFIQHLKRNYHLLLLNHKTKVPIKVAYKTPQTLGLDRLAAAVGGAASFKKENVLIIDLGTCIKYDFVNAKGNYLGGNIAPGLEMRLKSMHHYTSKLPKVKRKWNKNMLGVSTKTALQNGAIWGIKCEIENFIKTLTKKKGKIKVILAGGDSEYFGEIIESRIFVFPNLVLRGLNEILLYNQVKKLR